MEHLWQSEEQKVLGLKASDWNLCEKKGEIVRGFERSPDTLGIPDREDWMLRIDNLSHQHRKLDEEVLR